MPSLDNDWPKQFASREELIAEARRAKMAIHCNYQDLSWTADEFEKANAEGSFCWGVQNFTLLDPRVLLQRLETELTNKRLEIERLCDRFGIHEARKVR